MIPGSLDHLVEFIGDLVLHQAEDQLAYAVKTMGLAQSALQGADDKAAIGKALVFIERAQNVLGAHFPRSTDGDT